MLSKDLEHTAWLRAANHLDLFLRDHRGSCSACTVGSQLQIADHARRKSFITLDLAAASTSTLVRKQSLAKLVSEVRDGCGADGESQDRPIERRRWLGLATTLAKWTLILSFYRSSAEEHLYGHDLRTTCCTIDSHVSPALFPIAVYPRWLLLSLYAVQISPYSCGTVGSFALWLHFRLRTA